MDREFSQQERDAMPTEKLQTVVILSGGLDSTTLLYELLDAGHEVKALSFNYGQRHDRELEAAKTLARLTGVEHRTVDISGLSALFGANALTDLSVAVPHGEYTPATIAVTMVPNRNMIMLSIAAGSYTPYPDCQPSFVAAMNCATQLCDFYPITVLAPFVDWHKAEIVRRGQALGVPFELTWSCYQGANLHCGKCSTCLDRRAAFAECGLIDPVPYQS